MATPRARFHVGQLVRHALFDYRGVVVDVDPDFQLSEAWYQEVARSRPPKDQPWYHVLRHGTDVVTYVAERNLADEPDPRPIAHPLVDHYFSDFRESRYVTEQSLN